MLPAVGESSLEQRGDVTDGEQDVTLEEQTGTGQHHVLEVEADGRQRILLDHVADGAQLASGLLAVDLGDKADLLADGQIGPVDTFRGVAVVGSEQLVEGFLFMGVHLLVLWVAAHVGAMRRVGTESGHFAGWLAD